MKKGDSLGEKLLVRAHCELPDVTHRIPTGKSPLLAQFNIFLALLALGMPAGFFLAFFYLAVLFFSCSYWQAMVMSRLLLNPEGTALGALVGSTNNSAPQSRGRSTFALSKCSDHEDWPNLGSSLLPVPGFEPHPTFYMSECLHHSFTSCLGTGTASPSPEAGQWPCHHGLTCRADGGVSWLPPAPKH